MFFYIGPCQPLPTFKCQFTLYYHPPRHLKQYRHSRKSSTPSTLHKQMLFNPILSSEAIADWFSTQISFPLVTHLAPQSPGLYFNITAQEMPFQPQIYCLRPVEIWISRVITTSRTRYSKFQRLTLGTARPDIERGEVFKPEPGKLPSTISKRDLTEYFWMVF